MDPKARRGYRFLALAFVVVGAAFAGLALVQRLTGAHLLNGDPLGVALLILVIGGALWWTVRGPPAQEQAEEVAPTDLSAGRGKQEPTVPSGPEGAAAEPARHEAADAPWGEG
jgi:hypothetical protein